MSRPKSASILPPILWKRGLAWLLFLGPFFFICYGWTNHFTSQRGDVGVVVGAWERHLPFVPWLMLPYMSIDAFYAASLFLYRKRSLLDRHAQRLLLATVISCAGFLLFPLKFSFEVPRAEGFNGVLQRILLGFDQPYNQAPSLHISLLVVLWVAYAKKLQGAIRVALHIWFAAIAVSVLLVYQHHFIDVWTGGLAGLLCLYLIPDPPFCWRWQCPTARMKQMGLRYGIAAIVCAGVGWVIPSNVAQAILFWMAIAFALVTAAYFGLGSQIFQRYRGVTRWPARLLLTPYLLGVRLSALHYAKNYAAPSRISDRVWLGAFPSRHARQTEMTWHAVLDMTNEFSRAYTVAQRRKYLPVMDLTAPPITTLMRAVRWLDAAQREGKVLVHCALGLSRSASVIVCWWLWRGEENNIDAACSKLNTMRPGVVLTAEHKANIHAALIGLGAHV